MITAVVTNKDNTMIIELPKDTVYLQEQLLSIGITAQPKDIKLFGDEDDGIAVRLGSGSRMARQLCNIFTEENSLGDVNTATWLVQNAPPSFQEQLEDDIYFDKYDSYEKLVADIQKRTMEANTTSEEYYFPLTGTIDEGDGEIYTVNDRYLWGYEYPIAELVEQYRENGFRGLAEFYNKDDGVKSKLASAIWSVTDIQGTLYGKVTVRLYEPLTEEESTALKDWIVGQNSDGAFENLEDHPIEVGDGKLSISLWNDSDDYFVYDRAELDAYIGTQDMKMGGM